MSKSFFGAWLAFACFFGGATSALAYNCPNGCGSQCMQTVFGVSNVNPVCQAACQSWKHLNCHDLGNLNPIASACGEIGANAYIGGSNTMFGRSVGKRRRHLTLEERTILKSTYNMDLLKRAELHFGVPPLDRIGGGAVNISPGSEAQTFGYNIYLRHANADANVGNTGWMMLLGHELKHVEQFVNRGESLNRFGRDYFEGYCNAGMSYNGIPMERAAFGMEQNISNSTVAFFAAGGIKATDTKMALTCISNKTDFTVKYQAHWSDGSWTSYTLTPNQWRSHTWNYDFANENRSPKFYVRFDENLQQTGSQYQSYYLTQFSAVDSDCNRQRQHEEFKYTDNRAKINLFRNY